MGKNLLKEAIADAKTLREVAMANAELALKEAFAPQLKSMFSAQVNEMGDEEEGLDDLDLEGMDMMGGEEFGLDSKGGMPSEFGLDMEEGMDDGEEIDIDVPADLAGEDELGGIETDELGLEGMDLDGEFAFGEEGQDDDDLELEALIRELEGTSDEVLDIDGDTDDLEPADDTLREFIDDEINAPAQKTPLAVSAPFDTDVDGGGSAGALPVGSNYEIDPPGFNKVKFEESIDIDALIREIEGGTDYDAEDVSDGHTKQITTENKQLRRRLRSVTENLANHIKVINMLRSKMNEVNLMNARLLYTTKVLHKYPLSNKQKMSVVETFDRASTVREAKLVYTTLSESLRGATTSNKTAQKLTESMGASKATRSTKSDKSIISDVNNQVSRFQKLAGINKK